MCRLFRSGVCFQKTSERAGPCKDREATAIRRAQREGRPIDDIKGMPTEWKEREWAHEGCRCMDIVGELPPWDGDFCPDCQEIQDLLNHRDDYTIRFLENFRGLHDELEDLFQDVATKYKDAFYKPHEPRISKQRFEAMSRWIFDWRAFQDALFENRTMDEVGISEKQHFIQLKHDLYSRGYAWEWDSEDEDYNRREEELRQQAEARNRTQQYNAEQRWRFH